MTDRVKTAMAALQAKTVNYGVPKRTQADRGGPPYELYFGTTKASNEMLDADVTQHGGVETLFVQFMYRSDDWRYLGEASTDRSAVGAMLDNHEPRPAGISSMLNQGKAYYGEVRTGVPATQIWEVGYEPIKSASGNVIGAYFVGYKK
jgi:hypothetical protein